MVCDSRRVFTSPCRRSRASCCESADWLSGMFSLRSLTERSPSASMHRIIKRLSLPSAFISPAAFDAWACIWLAGEITNACFAGLFSSGVIVATRLHPCYSANIDDTNLVVYKLAFTTLFGRLATFRAGRNPVPFSRPPAAGTGSEIVAGELPTAAIVNLKRNIRAFRRHRGEGESHWYKLRIKRVRRPSCSLKR